MQVRKPRAFSTDAREPGHEVNQTAQTSGSNIHQTSNKHRNFTYMIVAILFAKLRKIPVSKGKSLEVRALTKICCVVPISGRELVSHSFYYIGNSAHAQKTACLNTEIFPQICDSCDLNSFHLNDTNVLHALTVDYIYTGCIKKHATLNSKIFTLFSSTIDSLFGCELHRC